MTTHQALSETPCKSTGNRLDLRNFTPEDVERLVKFYARVLTEDE